MVARRIRVGTPAAGATTVYDAVIASGSDAGWGGYTVRQVIGAANLSAATGQYIRITLPFVLVGDSLQIVAYVGQGSTGGDQYDTTAMVQLTGGDFGSGTYTKSGTTSLELVSGWVLLNEAYDEAKDLVVSLYSVGAGFTFFHVSDANSRLWYISDTGASKATANVASGSYGDNGAFAQIVRKIEITSAP